MVIKFLKNIFILISAIVLAWLASGFIGYNFCKIIDCGSSWVDATPFIGLLISYPIFLSFAFMMFGDRWKYFWIVGTYVSIFILFHFYEMFGFFIQLTLPSLLSGWVLGWGLEWGISKIRHK